MEIKDPLYQKIVIKNKYVQQLVKTQSMQRLKKIKQQGNTHFLKKGAIHNRFEHSLGVYNITEEILEYLTLSNQLKLSEFETHVALVSAILHDIGHGPFSHCFELRTLIDHEQWTEKFITEDQEIREILNLEPNLSSAILSVIKKEGKYKIIEEILFSELGADKLDYVNRDLYYCDEPIKSFNKKLIIQNILIIEGKLVYDYQALDEIENFFSIKRHLFDNTFFHPFVLGKDILLKEILKNINFINICKKINYTIYNHSLDFKNIPFDLYAQLNDKLIYEEVHSLRYTSDKILSYYCSAYIEPSSNLKWVELLENTRDENFIELLNNHQIVDIKMRNNKYSKYNGGVTLIKNHISYDLIDVSRRICTLNSTNSSTCIFYSSI